MSLPAASPELEQSVRQLSLRDNAPIKDIPRPTVKPPSTKKKAPVVADSWEDEVEADSDPSLSEIEQSRSSSAATPDPSPLSPSVSLGAEGPLDPPPTPISPQTSQPWVSSAPLPGRGLSSSPPRGSGSGSRSPARRPEKQTAVAGRLIAGALGIRAPKRTEEQRVYDRAMKEKEIRRRNREREEEAKRKEEEERAKAAVWDQ